MLHRTQISNDGTDRVHQLSTCHLKCATKKLKTKNPEQLNRISNKLLRER